METNKNDNIPEYYRETVKDLIESVAEVEASPELSSEEWEKVRDYIF